MKPGFISFAAMSLMTTTALAQTLPASNPLAKPNTLPFQAVPFDRIKDADYQPAIDAGMAEQRAGIARIADNLGALDFTSSGRAASSKWARRLRNFFAF